MLSGRNEMGRSGHGQRKIWRGELKNRLQIALFKGGWPARLSYQLGGQRHVRTTTYNISDQDLPKDTPILRLGFASDFHAGPITHRRLLKKTVDTLHDLEPDVILLGGDFVSLDARSIDWLAGEFARLSPPYGKFAVLGNHDHYVDDTHVADKLSEAGVELLINQSTNLPSPHQMITLIGLDDWNTG